MTSPEFDIFSGSPPNNAMWLESIVGFDHAVARMKQIAAQKPGPYFVFSQSSKRMVASTDLGAQTILDSLSFRFGSVVDSFREADAAPTTPLVHLKKPTSRVEPPR